MTFNDLKGFTCGEIGMFTLGQLQLDKFELLKLVASGEVSLPDTTWKKLCDLCRQTVNDFNSIYPNNPLEIPECISSPITTQMTPERLMQMITFIMAVITFIRGFLFPPAESTSTTFNIYNISIEDREQLQQDLDDISKYLPDPKEV